MTNPRLWRTGHEETLREKPSMIFVMAGDTPSPEDEFIGIMTSPEIAIEVVTAHNARLKSDRVHPLPFSTGPVPAYPHEAWQIMLQPGGLLAAFNIVQGRFVLTNASPDQILDAQRVYTRDSADYETRGILMRIAKGEPAYTRPIPFEEALERDKAQGGGLWQQFAPGHACGPDCQSQECLGR